MAAPQKFAATVILFFIIFPFSAGKGKAEEGAAAPPQSLDLIISQALDQNPELKVNEARWEAFIQQAHQAGSLEDPMFMLRAQNLLIRDPLAFDRDVMTAKVIGVSQTVPFFGKRGLQREVARQDAEVSRWILEERKIELTRMVKEAWYQLLFIDRSLEIVEKNIGVLDDLNRLSETLYSVGQGLLQDVLKAQVERSKMEEMRISLGQQRRSLEISLNILRFWPADTKITPAAPLELTALPLDAAQLEEFAITNRPRLKEIAAAEERAKAAQALAEKEFYPDATFTLEYMQRDPAMDEPGDDMYAAGVTFNLPVQRDRRHAMVAEAGAEIRMAQAERDMAINQIRQGIADALARLDRAKRLASLYTQSIIPQADQSLQAAMAAYGSGKADFPAVLDSQTALFNFEREGIEAIADHQMQLAVLEATIGQALP
ncbi:MAG TPA: TolC family protein [Desulfobulbaceae bacterium]|nr:TolC family protein [Desulfobulbaceae bacterium]